MFTDYTLIGRSIIDFVEYYLCHLDNNQIETWERQAIKKAIEGKFEGVAIMF